MPAAGHKMTNVLLAPAPGRPGPVQLVTEMPRLTGFGVLIIRFSNLTTVSYYFNPFLFLKLELQIIFALDIALGIRCL